MRYRAALEGSGGERGKEGGQRVRKRGQAQYPPAKKKQPAKHRLLKCPKVVAAHTGPMGKGEVRMAKKSEALGRFTSGRRARFSSSGRLRSQAICTAVRMFLSTHRQFVP